MKYLKKFDEEGIFDFLGISKSIEHWCIQLNLRNYTINEDNTVDVGGSIDLYYKKLGKIPIQFGIVDGGFSCIYNNLNSLKGCPLIVKGNFWCGMNELTSLINGPKEVDGSYDCSDNKLTSLEGGPKEVGGTYVCRDNRLVSLNGMPETCSIFFCYNNPINKVYELFGSLKAYKDSLDYNYWRGNDIIKLRLQEALEEIGKEAPDSIPGYKYI